MFVQYFSDQTVIKKWDPLYESPGLRRGSISPSTLILSHENSAEFLNTPSVRLKGVQSSPAVCFSVPLGSLSVVFCPPPPRGEGSYASQERQSNERITATASNYISSRVNVMRRSSSVHRVSVMIFTTEWTKEGYLCNINVCNPSAIFHTAVEMILNVYFVSTLDVRTNLRNRNHLC